MKDTDVVRGLDYAGRYSFYTAAQLSKNIVTKYGSEEAAMAIAWSKGLFAWPAPAVPQVLGSRQDVKALIIGTLFDPATPFYNAKKCATSFGWRAKRIKAEGMEFRRLRLVARNAKASSIPFCLMTRCPSMGASAAKKNLDSSLRIDVGWLSSPPLRNFVLCFVNEAGKNVALTWVILAVRYEIS